MGLKTNIVNPNGMHICHAGLPVLNLVMLFDEEVFIGLDINPSGRNQAWVAINTKKEVLTFQKTSLDKLLTFSKNIPRVMIGLETPATRSKNGKPVLPGLEYSSQPAGWILPAWQENLENRNIHPPAGGNHGNPKYQSAEYAEFYRQVFMLDHISIINVNAYSSLCCLLTHTPLPKSSLEGKIQRQLILLEQGINLPDPMVYFEELTRFKLLRCALPQKIILPLPELNTLFCAITAWKEKNEPENALQIGNPPDSCITLPVSELQESY